MSETLYLVKTNQPKLLKALKKQNLITEVTPLDSSFGAKRGRKPGRKAGPGRPPKV